MEGIITTIALRSRQAPITFDRGFEVRPGPIYRRAYAS
jgi:hypothetical protein